MIITSTNSIPVHTFSILLSFPLMTGNNRRSDKRIDLPAEEHRVEQTVEDVDVNVHLSFLHSGRCQQSDSPSTYATVHRGNVQSEVRVPTLHSTSSHCCQFLLGNRTNTKANLSFPLQLRRILRNSALLGHISNRYYDDQHEVSESYQGQWPDADQTALITNEANINSYLPTHKDGQRQEVD